MTLDLPAPDAQETKSLAECIRSRRSIREYSELPLPISCLSELLWSAQGITGVNGERATPSAKALYPLHLHVLVRRVAELKPGIYNYRADNHSLQLLDELPADGKIEKVGIGDQPWLKEAAMIIGVAANLMDITQRFEAQPPKGKRGKRYVYMETGALAQNVHLYATAMEIGCVLVGGFDDLQAKKVLGFPPEIDPTALLCIGHRRSV